MRTGGKLAASAPPGTQHKCVAGESYHQGEECDVRVAVHYYRHDGEARQFGLHVWEDVAGGGTSWEAPVPAVGTASEGWATFEVTLAPGATRLSFIVHRGDEQCVKVEGYDVTSAAARTSLWVVSGNGAIFLEEPDVRRMPSGVVDLKRARAVWVARDIIAVPFGGKPYTLNPKP